MQKQQLEEKVRTIFKLFEESRWSEWAEHFSKECRFQNSMLDAPLVGREQIIEYAKLGPQATTKFKWVVVEENRLVLGWSNRVIGAPKEHPWSDGVLTFLVDSDGYIYEYMNTFDTKQMIASMVLECKRSF